MKWVLAGMAFAVLISVAVFTVAIKIQSVRARARLETLTFELHLFEMERARQAESLIAAIREDGLCARLTEFVQQSGTEFE